MTGAAAAAGSYRPMVIINWQTGTTLRRISSLVGALALLLAGLVGAVAPSAHASTQHTQTADCSTFSFRTITVAPGDTIVISSSNCTGIATVSSTFTTNPTGLWTSNELNPTSGAATFPATITVDASPSAGTFDLRLKLNTAANWAIQVNIASPPATPSNISGTVGDQQSTLTWSGSFNGANPYYEIEQSTNNQNWSPVAGTCAGQVPTTAANNGCQVTGLSNGTPYFFRIRGIDNVGTSAWGVIASSVTPSLPPPAPTSVVGTAGNAQVSLSWTAPVMDSTYAAITGYKIEIYDALQGWNVAVADTSSNSTTETVSSLANGREYTFRVSAINGAGVGTTSADSAGVTPFTVPDGVDGMMNVTTSLASGTTDTLDVSWTAPSDQGSPITEYEVQIAESQPPSSPVFATPAGGTCAAANVTATSCTISGLTQGSSYLIQIRARNQAGWGPYGNSHTATVPGPAGAPQNPSTTTGDGQVVFSWALPTTWGGPTPTAGFSYDVEQSSNGGNSWTNAGTVTIPGLSQQQPNFPSTSSFTITGLTNGTSYDFRVSAVTSYGNGAWATATSVTPSTVPGAPASVTATRGDTQVLLAWTAPASNGGSAITDYEYEVSTDGGSTYATPVAVGSAATSVTVSGLTNGTAYVFRVKAKNTNGLSVTGTLSNSATPVALPGTPTGLSATHGNGQVSLSWTPGGSVGTSLTGHLIEVSTDGGSNWTTAIADTGSPSGSATVTGLTNGTSYVLRVAGISSAGTGLPLTLGSAVTPSTTPSAVTGLSAQVGDQQAVLTWTAGATGGSAITGYLIEQNDGTGWTQVTANTASSATTYTVTGLTNGTAYDFRVTPINTNGASVVTAPTLANPVTPIAAPGVPLQPTAVAGAGSATVTVAAGTGGAPSTYTVTASPGGRTCTVSGASGSCTISGLTPGTSYTFTATATNANSTSSASLASTAVIPTATPSSGGTSPGSGNSSGGGSSSGVTSGSQTPGNSSSPTPPPPSVNTSVIPGAQGAGATVGGAVVPVTVQPVSAPANGSLSNGTSVVVGSVSVQLNGPSMGGNYATTTLTVIPGQGVNLSASGFIPGSSVGLYAIPSGILVGSVVVKSDGGVVATTTLDPNAAAGMTALQMAGETADGIANISIAVMTTASATPGRTSAGALPVVPVGSSVVLVNGVPQVNTPKRTDTTINVVERGSALTLAARDSTGQTRPLRSNGEIAIQEQGLIALQGTGYRDYVDVFLFSEPVFVGRILVNPDGTFRGSLPVPAGLASGHHTLQSVGRGAGGEMVAISVSVRKLGQASNGSDASVARKAVAFHRDSVQLDAGDRQRLRQFMRSAGNDADFITVMGTYLKDKKTNRDVGMARERALVVKRYLEALGSDAQIDVGVRARVKSVALTTPNRYVVVSLFAN